MIIVGDNLLGLIRKYKICPDELFDTYSISILLDKFIYRSRPKEGEIIKYDLLPVDEFYEKECLSEKNGELILNPKESVLGCSTHRIYIPLGYMGLVQTKGSLARLFVSSIACDSQIEPGFKGKITLEIINHSAFTISIPIGAKVAQLFIFKCSTDNTKEYSGRYNEASTPTIPIPFSVRNTE